MKSEKTYLGRISSVIGAKVIAEITEDLPSASPIIHGRIFRIGQVGSFVRIPLGLVNLYGVVSTIGSNIFKTSDPELVLPYGQRWLEIQMLGEAIGGSSFQRGVSVFPTIDDEVH